MSNHKFDVKKLDKLNNPTRLESLNFNAIIDELNLPSNSILVDIGAGTGLFSEKFLSLLPSANGFAFDISTEMINWMNENRVPNLNGRLYTALMQENKIPFDDKKADFVFMIMLHHELEDSSKLLKEVNRILKDNGKLLICDWKEEMHHHFVKKETIISDIKDVGFDNIKEMECAENLVCFIASKI